MLEPQDLLKKRVTNYDFQEFDLIKRKNRVQSLIKKFIQAPGPFQFKFVIILDSHHHLILIHVKSSGAILLSDARSPVLARHIHCDNENKATRSQREGGQLRIMFASASKKLLPKLPANLEPT